MARYQTQTFKLCRHHHSLPVTAIAIHVEVFAGKAGSDHGLNLFSGHFE
jgi:hypothetical protein